VALYRTPLLITPISLLSAPPILANILDLPETVSTLEAAIAATEGTLSICKQLLERVQGSSSRLALQYQVIFVIGNLFTRILPLPRPRDSLVPDFWMTPQPKKRQVEALQGVYHLMLLYGEVWQSIEAPVRGFDCERSVVGTCMLAVFDVLVRTQAAEDPLIVSELLNENGGTSFSYTVCQDSRDFEKSSSMMELDKPWLAKARSDALAYLASVRKACSRQLFEYRMPEKIEIKK
jgi:hypothetical protein